ncbi:MAG: glycine betaine ABC transporter substrate-binding protein [Chloroflexota bacterium]
MTFRRTIALGASSLALVAMSSLGASAQGPTIRIGSDNFYESKVVAEIYSQVLEGQGWTVDRQFGLGSRAERNPAFQGGQVDLVPEYVGSGLGYYTLADGASADLAALKVTGDGATNAANLQQALKLAGVDATVLGISAGEDTNAAVVRADTASSLGLAKMSDLAAHQADLTWGIPPDCDSNPLCKGALEQYGITYPPAKLVQLAACDSPIADALNGKAIDFAWLCSTQPQIAQYGFVVLEDDLDTQPAENLAPLVRNDFLAKAGVDAAALGAILDPVSALITTDALTQMGVKVAVDQADIEDVAKEFLATIQLPAASPAS